MILESDPDHITETFSFGLPFFKYKKKMLCYLYYSKKYKRHYISFYHGDGIHYPELIQDGRKKFKILLIDMDKDLPVSFIMNVIDDIKQYI